MKILGLSWWWWALAAVVIIAGPRLVAVLTGAGAGDQGGKVFAPPALEGDQGGAAKVIEKGLEDIKSALPQPTVPLPTP